MDKATRDRIKKQILNKSIYKKKKYIDWRNKVFKRDRYTCQMCSKVGGSIQAHHIAPKFQYPAKIFELANGITLCYSCHQKVHKEDMVKALTRKFRKLARENKPKPRITKKRRIRRKLK